VRTKTPDRRWALTKEAALERSEKCVNAIRRFSVLVHVTSLAQGPPGVGGAYDDIAVDNGHNGGALSLGPPVERAETEEAAVGPCWTPEQFWAVLAAIHHDHYSSLVRLAALFLDGAGEDTVQEAIVRVAGRWDRIREADKVLVYVRRAVVNGAISERRHRRRVQVLSLDALKEGLLPRRQGQSQPSKLPPAEPVEEITLRHLADEAVVASVRRLQGRQRECIALRFCLNLSEKETAEVLGITPGCVKKHVSRAMTKLRPALEAYR
jgi:RNA polymerase sigma factor (sigma-70 family)